MSSIISPGWRQWLKCSPSLFHRSRLRVLPPLSALFRLPNRLHRNPRLERGYDWRFLRQHYAGFLPRNYNHTTPRKDLQEGNQERRFPRGALIPDDGCCIVCLSPHLNTLITAYLPLPALPRSASCHLDSSSSHSPAPTLTSTGSLPLYLALSSGSP